MRKELLQQIWDVQRKAYYSLTECDSIPFHYGSDTLYAAETIIIERVAENPGITATDLAFALKKTVSACSQIIRRLRAKGWIEQTRNSENNRIYNLTLTESGTKIYQANMEYNLNSLKRIDNRLTGFTEEELAVYLRVQQTLNGVYEETIQDLRKQAKKH